MNINGIPLRVVTGEGGRPYAIVEGEEHMARLKGLIGETVDVDGSPYVLTYLEYVRPRADRHIYRVEIDAIPAELPV